MFQIFVFISFIGFCVTSSQLLKSLSYYHDIESINKLIYNLTISKTNEDEYIEEVKKLSKIKNMHDRFMLQRDLVYSSMMVFENNKYNKRKPNTDIYNAIKPLDLLKTKTDVEDGQHYLIDGDMRIHHDSTLGKEIRKQFREMKKSKRKKRKIAKKLYLDGYSSRWPLNIVPYQFDANITANTAFQQTILQAINHWQLMTCIQFLPYDPVSFNSTHRSRLVFHLVQSGCYSDVGYPDVRMTSPGQTLMTSVYISSGCVFGQIVHEIGHTIGFYHEQSRGDRDTYVTILWGNIIDQSSYMINFYSAASEIEPDNLKIQYDLSSVMHYEGTAFGINGSDTIVANDDNLAFLMGNRVGLSFYDIKMANIAYNCSIKCINPPVCQNDGFLMANCTCKCPDGVSGTQCESSTYTGIKSTLLQYLNLSCSFQDDFCSWIQEQNRDETDFVRNKGSTLSQYYFHNTGPTADPFNSTNNYYIYLNSYYMKYMGESAMLVTPEISTNINTSICVSFWYNMYGDSSTIVGGLYLYKKDSSNINDMTLLWYRTGNQGINWLYASVDISVLAPSYRIIFKAQRVSSFLGDIALDNISVKNGPCSSVSTSTTTTTTSTVPTTTSNVINGGWSNWTDWQSCNYCSIQNGVLLRFRYCNNPAPSNGGLGCIGLAYDYQFCLNAPQCAVSGGWSAWSSWSSCSQTCGLGTSTRTRQCNNPVPQFSGTCDGSNIDIQICTYGTCVVSTLASTSIPTITIPINIPVTTQISLTTPVFVTQTQPSCSSCTPWSSWSSCNRNCGSLFMTQQRTRVCSTQFDIQNCMNISFQNCNLTCTNCLTSDNGLCLPTVDGQWSEWGMWGSCSVTCGNGTQIRKRTCTNPEPLNGGASCLGNDTDVSFCSIDCTSCWSSWSQWSSCSVSCGTWGYSMQTRYSIGSPCSGVQNSLVACWPGSCSNPTLTQWSSWTVCTSDNCTSANSYRYRFRTCLSSINCGVPLVDKISCSNMSCLPSTSIPTTTTPFSLIGRNSLGQWSDWSDWSLCNTTCNTGNSTQMRSRYCLSATSPCIGNSVDYQTCTNCPDPVWSNWTDFTPCSQTCGYGFQTSTRTCLIVTGQTKRCIGDSVRSQVCFIKLCQIDGGWSSWSDWSSCSKTCDQGLKKRVRLCVSPPPSNGGNDCVGDTVDIAVCNSSPCGWSDWSNWSNCSTKCGIGNQTRTRACNGNIGVDCKGSDTNTHICNGTDCVAQISNTLLCTFNQLNEPYCNLNNNGYFNWTIWSFMTSTVNTGPSGDYPTGFGNYLYAESSPPQKSGDVAKVETNQMISSSNGSCLSFWYNMYGSEMGKLSVKMIYGNNDQEALLFKRTGNQGTSWINSLSFIPQNITFKLVFEAIIGSGFTSDMAIDDIKVEPNSLNCEIFNCNFETPDNCNYGELNADMLWLPVSGYLTIANYQTSLPGQRAYFTFPQLNSHKGQILCFSFLYKLGGYSDTSSTLNLYIIKNNDIAILEWSSSSSNGVWLQENLEISDNIASSSDTYQLIFEAIRGNNAQNNINLAKIQLMNGYCSVVNAQVNSRSVRNTRVKKRQVSQNNCGGIYTISPGQQVTITSPNYPNNYDLNIECSYIINTTPNHTMSIQITDMDIEYTGFDLCVDSLEIRYYALGQMGVRLCGTLNSIFTNNNINEDNLNFTTYSNTAMLYFRSDWLVTRKGFQAQIIGL